MKPAPTPPIPRSAPQAAFELVVEPVVHSYQPDLIIVAAGYDAAKGDPLGGCRLTPQVRMRA